MTSGGHRGPIHQKPKRHANKREFVASVNKGMKDTERKWTINPSVASRANNGRLTVTVEGNPKDIKRFFWHWRRIALLGLYLLADYLQDGAIDGSLLVTFGGSI